MRISKYLNHIPCLDNKNIIVTGANSGIGFELCKFLLLKKAHVKMACRDLCKANKAKEKLLQLYPQGNIEIYLYDQSSFQSIESFVNNIDFTIDGLVCNAGIYFPKRDLKTVDGYELTLGTNYLGVYHLINLLTNKLLLDKSRIVIVSSLIGYLKKKDQLTNISKMSRHKLYGFSKLLLSEYASYLNTTSLEVLLVHPGLCNTNILSSKDTGFSKRFILLGRKFLNMFCHSASKASLSLLKGLTIDYQKDLYIKPRGIFAISGCPTVKHIPKKFKNTDIISQTNNYLKGGNKHVDGE